MNVAHEGGCACGRVRFEVRGPLGPVVACHCESCRRQTGSFVMASAVAADDLAILTGAERLAEWRASDSAVRRHCSDCGSFLFWQPDGGDRVSVMAGALDQPTGLALSEHIFVGEKGDFYDIVDALPCHAGPARSC